MVQFDASDTANLVVLRSEILPDGTIDCAKLSGGVAVSTSGVDFPGNIVNTACVSRAVIVLRGGNDVGRNDVGDSGC